ncbi:MAG TPA: epoxide hydrolase [Frankiaceae bacterium]|nr:epoxide hydrolase [Frankiaceae bacterium]
MQRGPVRLSDEVLADLQQRLDRVRWPDSVGASWELGTDLVYLKELTSYWRHDFDWRTQEALLEQVLPSSIAMVDGEPVHFARVPGAGPKALPLLLMHGWPGSYAEFVKVAPMLADPAAYGGDPADCFEVIVPSLPGHGFSFVPRQTGFGADECAGVMSRLMRDVLGFSRYGAQGGDRGAFVCASMGFQRDDALVGIHVNFPAGIAGEGGERTEEESQWLHDTAAYMADGGGYMAIQGTRPQTLAYGLHDSPVGQLAWILEKWRAWSDCGGDVESVFTKDEILVNATIYWATGTMRSSTQWYWEHAHRPPAAVRPVRIECPTGVARFPRDVMQVPRTAAERKYDLRRWTEVDRGGHFAALEQPEILVEEIRAFFRPLR